jgi:hypothetical protein
MNPNAVLKFLQSLRSLAKSGAVKSVDQAMDFAKREFGEVTDLLKRQIEQVFKKPTIKAPKPGEGGITSIKNAPKKEIPDQASGIMATEESTPLMSRLEKGAETLRGFKQPGMDLTTGMARTAARVILDNAGIKVPEKVDPLEVIAKEFGGDVLMDLKDVAEELIEKERTGRITESMGEFLESRGMFNLQRGRTDAPQGMSDEELEQIKKQVDQEKMLKDFDPKDRTENSMGGIQRLQFKLGGTKKLLALIKEIKKLNPIEAMKEVNEVVAKRGKYENLSDTEVKTIFDETNDHIFERDVPADEFAVRFDEEIDLPKGVDPRDTILPTRSFKGTEIKDPKFDEDMPFDNNAEKLAEIKMSNEAYEQQKILDDVDEAYGMAPKMVERFQLKERFPGIPDELLTRIIDDPDPQNKAEAIATLDQAMELTKQGKDTDEIISVLERIKKSRKDNSKGGLQYLMGM